MQQTKEKLDEILSLLKEKDPLYITKSQELIDLYANLEKKEITPETQLTAILLNFICGNYSLFGFNFNLISEETLKSLQAILSKISNKVYPDITTELSSLKNIKEKINPLIIQYVNETYRQKQIEFIRQFFSKINYNSLSQYFPSKEVDSIISNQKWVKEKDYVIPNNITEADEFNVAKEVEDVRFINSTNIQLNKLIKEHANLVNYLNKKK